MTDSTITTRSSNTIIVSSPSATPMVTEDDPEIIVVEARGPRGATGEQGNVGATGVQGQTGKQGQQGEQGKSGAGLGFRFVQSTPSKLWDVEHDLTAAFPSVSAIRSDGRVITGRVTYLAPGHLTIWFSAAIAGEAYLT